jgi:putative SOS response-associated peptidase YedK
MCTRYISPEAGDMERHWHIGRQNPWRGGEVFPNYQGPFIRAARDVTEHERELVIGQWSLIPWFAKERKLKFPTSNARSEELADKASYKLPWSRGQRCIIPALAFVEPNWETGKHIPWIFRRADGDPWGLAGLWNVWTDKATGEMVESYTMLTINADGHPMRPPHMQDKRSVIPIEIEDVGQWLYGTVDEARELLTAAPAEAFDAVLAVS